MRALTNMRVTQMLPCFEVTDNAMLHMYVFMLLPSHAHSSSHDFINKKKLRCNDRCRLNDLLLDKVVVKYACHLGIKRLPSGNV